MRKKEKKTMFRQLYDEAVRSGKVEAAKPTCDLLGRITNATGCTERTARNWIYGAQRPSRHSRELLAREFGTTPEELFGAGGTEQTDTNTERHDNDETRG